MRTFFDIHYLNNSSEMQMLDMYLPDHAGFETIVWFHGGGFETGSRKINVYAEPFVEKGYGFVSVEYRMYPEARFPELDAARTYLLTETSLAVEGNLLVETPKEIE